MSDGPSIEVYKGVEIRYGYAITLDGWMAHFELPAKPGAESGGFQKEVKRDMAPPVQAGKQPAVRGDSERSVLAQARSVIDNYLNA